MRPTKPLLLALAAVISTGQAAASPLLGAWRNPRGTVDVRIAPCGASLCGDIVRASPKAEADARAAGYDHLLGLRLLREYQPAGANHWTGHVLVPDWGREFTSHIDLIDADHARIAGCLVGQFLCKSQTWRRL